MKTNERNCFQNIETFGLFVFSFLKSFFDQFDKKLYYIFEIANKTAIKIVKIQK